MMIGTVWKFEIDQCFGTAHMSVFQETGRGKAAFWEGLKNILNLNLIEQCTSILEIISPQVEERGNSLNDLRLFTIRCKTWAINWCVVPPLPKKDDILFTCWWWGLETVCGTHSNNYPLESRHPSQICHRQPTGSNSNTSLRNSYPLNGNDLSLPKNAIRDRASTAI